MHDVFLHDVFLHHISKHRMHYMIYEGVPAPCAESGHLVHHQILGVQNTMMVVCMTGLMACICFTVMAVLFGHDERYGCITIFSFPAKLLVQKGTGHTMGPYKDQLLMSWACRAHVTCALMYVYNIATTLRNNNHCSHNTCHLRAHVILYSKHNLLLNSCTAHCLC